MSRLRFRHYDTVPRPSVVYASQCWYIDRKGPLRKLELKDQKILRKILRPVRIQGGHKMRHHQELYPNIKDLFFIACKIRDLLSMIT